MQLKRTLLSLATMLSAVDAINLAISVSTAAQASGFQFYINGICTRLVSTATNNQVGCNSAIYIDNTVSSHNFTVNNVMNGKLAFGFRFLQGSGGIKAVVRDDRGVLITEIDSGTKVLQTSTLPSGWAMPGYTLTSDWTTMNTCPDGLFWPTNPCSQGAQFLTHFEYKMGDDSVLDMNRNYVLGPLESGEEVVVGNWRPKKGSLKIPVKLRMQPKAGCPVRVAVVGNDDRVKFSNCDVTFNDQNYNQPAVLVADLQHHNFNVSGDTTFALNFDLVTYSVKNSSECYDNLALHGFRTPVTITKSYRGGTDFCRLWGDPHYQTFDQPVTQQGYKFNTYDFHGKPNSKYFQVRSDEFSVQATHVDCNRGLLCATNVAVRYRDEIAVFEESSRTMLNRVVIYSPRAISSSNPQGEINATLSSINATYLSVGRKNTAHVVFINDRNIPVGEVSRVTNYHYDVTLHRKFMGRTYGVCAGTYNGNLTDDQFIKMDGVGINQNTKDWTDTEGILEVAERNIYSARLLESEDVQNFRSRSSGICVAPSLSEMEKPVSGSGSSDTQNSGNEGVAQPGDDTRDEVIQITTVIDGQTRVVAFTTRITLQLRNPTLSPTGTPGDLVGDGLIPAIAAAGAVGAVALVGMGAFMIHRRRKMLREAEETIYALESAMSAHSLSSQMGSVNQRSGFNRVGSDFIENPLYENASAGNSRTAREDDLGSIHSQMTGMSSMEGLTEMSGSMRSMQTGTQKSKLSTHSYTRRE